ncbi:MAG: tetratricopeptide repeat protein [Bacteroidales bacterium]|nr:tetratricopeptide repeat protein [Bacteroidales bacterium]
MIDLRKTCGSFALIIMVFVFLFSFSANAQSFKKLVNSAEDAMNSGNYYGASIAYKKALDLNKVPKVAFRYADACRLNHNYPEALKWYKFVELKEGKNNPMVYYWLGDVLKSTGEYQKAISSYKKFLNYSKELDNFYTKKANHELLACEQAFYLKINPVGVEITKINSNVNSPFSEYGISDIGDSILLFSSFRPDEQTKTSFESRIYSSSYNDDDFSRALILDDYINIPEFFTANPAFSKKTETLYFTMGEKIQGKVTSAIYCSFLNDDGWSKPIKLPEKINKPGFASLQPSIAVLPDKEFLLFVSNRDGGMGKLDIWYSEVLENGEFGEVYNMGSNLNQYDESQRFFFEMKSNINSIDDDVSPFYNPFDSTLYFSSLWHNNLGGFDIFKSKGNFVEWSDPVNLGYPINTNDNELYFYISSKHSHAFFASNRPESFSYNNDRCCNDIYYIKLESIVNEEEEEEKILIVLENELRKLIPLTLYFHNDEPNPRTRDTSTTVNYKDSYQSYINMTEEYKKEYSKGVKRNDKEDAVSRIETFFDEEVKEGFSDLENFSLLLEELLPKGSIIELTVKGYASPLHASDYNVNLSKRRIHSLINYFYEYKDSLFVDYINNGQLSFEKIAFGEDEAAEDISDDLFDLKSSVYSPEAAYERKIRLIAVEIIRQPKD